MKAVAAAFAKLLEYEQRSHSEESGSDGLQVHKGDWAGVIFRLGDDHLVCSVDHIHEFLPLPSVTPVPGAKPWLLGLSNIRGDLMTVVDLAGFLTGKRSPVTMRSRLLTASLRGRPVGLMVDEVFGQRHFAASASSKAKIGKDSPLSAYVRKQYRSGKEAWSEVDLDTLFSTPDFLNGSAL